jgi:hypothetical protein
VFDSVILFAGTEFCVKMCRHNVVLSNCSVGEFCIIHNGACVGQDGEQLSMCTDLVLKSSNTVRNGSRFKK